MSEVNDAPATRADLAKLEHKLDHKIDQLEHKLDHKIDQLAAATQAGFAEIRTEMAEQGRVLRTEMAEVFERGIRVMGEQLSAQLRAYDEKYQDVHQRLARLEAERDARSR